VCGRDKRRQRNAGTPTAIFAAGAKKSKWWKGTAEQSGGREGKENRGVKSQGKEFTRKTKPAGKRLAVWRRRPEPSSSEFIQGESAKRKERRRRNTFRVGHTETPQMPSFHNRLLPSAPFLLTRPNILLNFLKRLCLSPPPSPYNPTLLRRFALFPHHPALRGVFYSPFSLLSTL
jgi:hypothetical protein